MPILNISEKDIENRFVFDNPWWNSADGIEPVLKKMPRRGYLPIFSKLVRAIQVKRSVVLLGPRRVGKTVMVQHMIQELLDDGVPPETVLYLSLETPVYIGISLESLLERFRNRFRHARDRQLYIFFDEVQYLKDWEVHLKSLVDSHPFCRFVVSGSAAAALRLKSQESGAGRFTDFLLPPLTFAEYLKFTDQESQLIEPHESGWGSPDLTALNEAFLDYLNYGGYPEVVFNADLRRENARFIRSDIIDKVLLRDLPQLYGIRDVQELNHLFTTLAYNSGNEISLESLSNSSGVSKATLSRYLEYLEAAFLIQRVHKIDFNAKRFQRATAFKVYLTNPAMRSALFGTLTSDCEAMGGMAETGIFAQWFQHGSDLRYARWDSGEIDIVGLLSHTQKPSFCVEVKWSDRPVQDASMLRHVIAFARHHSMLEPPLVTTKTTRGTQGHHGVKVEFMPTALYAYELAARVFATHALPDAAQMSLRLPT